MTATTLLWIYIVLLLVGGLMGFVKAKSKISLIVSALFAACLIATIFYPVQLGKVSLADLILGVLLIFFAVRFSKTRKFMPGGLMAIATLLVLVLRQVLGATA